MNTQQLLTTIEFSGSSSSDDTLIKSPNLPKPPKALNMRSPSPSSDYSQGVKRKYDLDDSGSDIEGISPLSSQKSARYDNPCKEVFPISEKKFQRKVFHCFAELDEKLDKLLVAPSCNTSGHAEVSFTAVESYDEFLELEEKLNNDDYRELVEKKLQKTQGYSIETFVSGALKR